VRFCLRTELRASEEEVQKLEDATQAFMLAREKSAGDASALARRMAAYAQALRSLMVSPCTPSWDSITHARVTCMWINVVMMAHVEFSSGQGPCVRRIPARQMFQAIVAAGRLDRGAAAGCRGETSPTVRCRCSCACFYVLLFSRPMYAGSPLISGDQISGAHHSYHSAASRVQPSLADDRDGA
jgi:hypothetical protein